MNAVSIRGDWVGQLIGGRYTLLEWLGGSGTSAVFLTQLPGDASQKAAIKLLPVSSRAEDHFGGWASASSLSHPNLLRIFDFGRSEIDNTAVVYIVTELAEEILSQIIPERPLSAAEARQMLNPVLDALEYLHKSGYAHGHLKPSNILVVSNEIKLSSDALLSLGHPAPELLSNDIHIAPETASDPVAPSADIWSLGMTLVEALTQQLPIWDAASDTEPIIPTSVPPPFNEIVRKCLVTVPSQRCKVADIRAMLDSGPAHSAPVHVLSAATPHLPHHQLRLVDKSLPARKPLIPLIIGFVLLVAIIIGLEMHSRKKTDTAPLQTETTQQASSTEPDSKQPASQVQPSAPPAPSNTAAPLPELRSTGGDVLSRSIPDVPRSASNTIHGTVSVAVRVTVDPTGSVTNAEFASHGPSAYFARLALDSARNWKFKPSQQDGRAAPSTWTLHYRFRRDGVEVTPTNAASR